MHKPLRHAAGILAATGVLSLARPALAQMPAYPSPGVQAPAPRVQHPENTVLSEGFSRLEEMKIELAWLAEIATFPYYLGARVNGEHLEVRGLVPNNLIKQRALEVARQHTFLTVTDGLKIQTNLSRRPPLRRAEVLKKEGAELLAKHLGKSGQQCHIEARPNGLVVVSGPIGSVEEKLEVSRLFRRLSGCSGIVNLLTVPPILRHGQRVVQVTRDGAQTVPAQALTAEAEQIVSPPVAQRPGPVAPGPMPGTGKPVTQPILPLAAPGTATAPAATMPVPRIWPPAHDVRPPGQEAGRPGVIIFEDDPPATSPVRRTTTREIQSIAPADLKRQVKAVCGRQAQDVKVEVQPDRGLLVKVKVPNLAIEKQLSTKILALPDMTAPGVRLSMEVSK